MWKKTKISRANSQNFVVVQMKVFQTPNIEEAGSDKCSSEIVLSFSLSPRPQPTVWCHPQLRWVSSHQ